jgi:Histidine phosphatase superfamily (branch 1)
MDSLLESGAAALDRVVERRHGGVIACVSHGGFINAVLGSWTGAERHMWFVPWHTGISSVLLQGEALVIHRWDIVGDDATSGRLLGEPWFTEHSVVAVGRPLLVRGYQRWSSGGGEPFTARLRVPGGNDLIVSVGGAGPSVELGEVAGAAVLESDAAARALLLWGRQPADPSRLRSQAGPAALGAARRLLAGY